jgi:hypothetical protein
LSDVPEFQVAPKADRGRILVKCFPQAIKGKPVKEKEYRYNGDKEDSYGNANLPIPLPFELRSLNSTDLGDDLKIYED